MGTPETMINALREFLSSSGLGLVTQADLARLEIRVDELTQWIDELEQKLNTCDD